MFLAMRLLFEAVSCIWGRLSGRRLESALGMVYEVVEIDPDIE